MRSFPAIEPAPRCYAGSNVSRLLRGLRVRRAESRLNRAGTLLRNMVGGGFRGAPRARCCPPNASASDQIDDDATFAQLAHHRRWCAVIRDDPVDLVRQRNGAEG